MFSIKIDNQEIGDDVKVVNVGVFDYQEQNQEYSLDGVLSKVNLAEAVKRIESLWSLAVILTKHGVENPREHNKVFNVIQVTIKQILEVHHQRWERFEKKKR